MNARMFLVITLSFGCASIVSAGDWPQWRGANRDAKVTGFEAPATWPRSLTEKWKVKIGDGVATPSLVGDRLYVFSREGNDEVIRCLDAKTGKEIWSDKYESGPATGAASGFPGPRCSPTVADGKVVTLGVRGVLSCYDAASGKKLWRKDDTKGWPSFYTSSSPVIVNGMCIAQLGSGGGGMGGGRRPGGGRPPAGNPPPSALTQPPGGRQTGGGGGGSGTGAIVAFDLNSGEQKWKCDADGTAYASPELLTVDGKKMLVAQTAGSVVGVDLADGKQLWKVPFRTRYNAATPVVDHQTIIFSGSGGGTHAIQVEKSGDGYAAKNLWDARSPSVQYNTPIVKNGHVFGLSDDDMIFCLDAKTGKSVWTKEIAPGGGGGGRAPGAGGPGGGQPPGGGGRPGGGRPGGGGRMGGNPIVGYGSIVDAGSVLFSLTPRGELAVFEPSDKEYKKLASYKVAERGTYAYPVIAGKNIYIKDKDSVTMWALD